MREMTELKTFDVFFPGELDSQTAGVTRGGGGEQERGGDHQQRGRGVQLRQQVVSPGELRSWVRQQELV